MSEKELKANMAVLYNELTKSTTDKEDKVIIAKAVSLGMKYQEEKIKQGIGIVFNELNK